MLIPIQLHLTRKEINRMVEAENLDILYGLIGAGAGTAGLAWSIWTKIRIWTIWPTI